jgi:hypothetical protein
MHPRIGHICVVSFSGSCVLQLVYFMCVRCFCFIDDLGVKLVKTFAELMCIKSYTMNWVHCGLFKDTCPD